MFIRRIPCPALRPFVALLWASDGTAGGPLLRERVLPTGSMHLVVRLGGASLRLYSDAIDTAGRTVDAAVVGGARAEPYLREAGGRVASVGAQLQPGAAGLLLGAPAGALAGAHTCLDALWGREAERLRERLEEAVSPQARLDLFEQHLLARVAGCDGLAAPLDAALRCLAAGGSVSHAAEASGFSHRHFLVRFREEVGLAPKAYGRVLRLQRVLARLAHEPAAPWADVALDAGFADQAHLARDFRELTGLTPSAYRALAPAQPHHVPLRSDSFKP